jgi:hypothetical protein
MENGEVIEKTETKTIRVNDVVECLTPDGWECGRVTAISEDTITVFMDYLYEDRDFTLHLVRI